MASRPVFRSFRGALGSLLIFALPAASFAQVIDNFEQGTFHLMGTTFDSGVQSFLAPINCITIDRVDRMFINGNPSGADLNLGSPDDQVTTVWGNGGGRLEFDYDLSAAADAVDLTYGGTMNALRVFLPVAVAAGRIEIFLSENAAGAGDMVSRQIVGPGVYSIPLNLFAGVDVGAIRFIQLAFDIPDFGDYHIADFRAWEDPTVAAAMDVEDGLAEGPPYPTDDLQIVMYAPGPTGGNIPTEMIALSLQNLTNAGSIPSVEMIASDSGGGIGMPGEQVGIIVVDTMPQMKSEMPHFRTFDGLRFDFQGRGEFTSELAFPPSFRLADDMMSMQLSFKTYSRDRNGHVQFRTDYMLGFETPEGSGLSFSNAFVQDLGVQPEPFFELSFDVDSSAANKTSKQGDPMVLIQMSGAIYPLGSTVAAPHFTGSESLALWAQPNVMSASTQLWMSRSRSADTKLQLFDLAGRAVQTLTIPAGQEFAVWNGRDARGVPVSSGMYFLRALNAPNTSAAKIVKLR